jgi:hypothetical protein
MKWEDGKGSGRAAGVSANNRGDVSSRNASRIYYTSRDFKQAYNWVSSFSASTGNEIIYLKNDSQVNDLYIDHVLLSAEAGRATFALYEVSGTAAGTTLTGVNLNLKSSNTADVTSFGNAAVTGLTLGNKIEVVSAPDDTTVALNVQDALILGFNNAIAIEFTGSAGNVNCVISGFFEEIGN